LHVDSSYLLCLAASYLAAEPPHFRIGIARLRRNLASVESPVKLPGSPLDGLPRLPKLPFGELALGLPRIYAIAYDQSAEARRFYAFQKALETYERTVAAETILALSTDNELYRLGKEGG